MPNVLSIDVPDHLLSSVPDRTGCMARDLAEHQPWEHHLLHHQDRTPEIAADPKPLKPTAGTSLGDLTIKRHANNFSGMG